MIEKIALVFPGLGLHLSGLSGIELDVYEKAENYLGINIGESSLDGIKKYAHLSIFLKNHAWYQLLAGVLQKYRLYAVAGHSACCSGQ